MSCLIKLPKLVKIEIRQNLMTIKGPLGSEVLNCPYQFENTSNQLKISSFGHNLTTFQTWIVILQQLIKGTLVGYKKELKLIGLGYRVQIIENNCLQFKLGFSNPVIKVIPNYLKLYCPKPNRIIIKGTNLQKINEFISQLQSYRPPEPYKGKGILLINQQILRKQGKKS
jgi:large subunit ribosomal protein L6